MMKKHLFSSFAVTMLMAFLASFTLSSCSEEIILEDKQEVQQEEILDIPEGAVVFSTTADDATRTSIGLDAKFYWTAGNVIWVDIAQNKSFSLGSNAMEMSADNRMARFFFSDFPEESERKPSYNLIYTGSGASYASRQTVTIPADQSQTIPNDSACIGRNGDCATAVATRNEKGQYTFKLKHKAHYLILQPYKEDNNNADWKLDSINIIELDGKPLSGTFDFATTGDISKGEAGLVASSVQNAKDTIKICTGEWALPKKANADKNNWYAVIAPDFASTKEHRLKIKYRIKLEGGVNCYNGNKEDYFTIVKELTISSDSNKVTKIKHKMTVESFSTNVFYMWDATASYWNGVSNPPTFYYDNTDPKSYNADYPKSGDDRNRFTTVTTAIPAAGQAAQYYPCRDLPNVNAMTWYAIAGDARWDNEYPWRFDDDFEHIYTKGTWFKKWDVIVAENIAYLEGQTKANCSVSFTGTVKVYKSITDEVGESRTYTGDDYRSNGFKNNTWFQPRFLSYRFDGRPNDVSKYFFLPANGHVGKPGDKDGVSCLTLGGDIHGCYWSSSAVPGANPPKAYIMELKSYSLQVRQDNGQVYHSDSTKMSYQGRAAEPSWWQ